MDFKLTDDGDLSLGQQVIDDEGYLLYYKDVKKEDGFPVTTVNIEESISPIRDIETVSVDEERLQLMKSRLQTDNPDWYLYEDVGASLSDFIGMINSPDTANLIERRVVDTLLRNDAFSVDELDVNVIPVSLNEVLIDIILTIENKYLRYAIKLDFNVGINNIYTLDREGNII